MEFHINLQKAREVCGLTQQQVADQLGIAKSTYSNYENGKREPDVKKIKALTRILGISGDALLETGFENNNFTKSNQSEHQLLSLYNQLNTQGQEKLVDYADDLVTSGKYIKTDSHGLAQKEA